MYSRSTTTLVTTDDVTHYSPVITCGERFFNGWRDDLSGHHDTPLRLVFPARQATYAYSTCTHSVNMTQQKVKQNVADAQSIYFAISAKPARKNLLFSFDLAQRIVLDDFHNECILFVVLQQEATVSCSFS